jgi:hypothetical protein
MSPIPAASTRRPADRARPQGSQHNEDEPGPAEPAAFRHDRPELDWKTRAADNIASIRLMRQIEEETRNAAPEEQEPLALFTSFCAGEFANNLFRRSAEEAFPKGWEDLEHLVSSGELASLARVTQYAHFTPEFMVRAMWRALRRMGFSGGRVLEPGYPAADHEAGGDGVETADPFVAPDDADRYRGTGATRPPNFPPIRSAWTSKRTAATSTTWPRCRSTPSIAPTRLTTPACSKRPVRRRGASWGTRRRRAGGFAAELFHSAVIILGGLHPFR